MDDAKQFLLSTMQTLKERFGNPFIGAFITAWCTWNIRILLVVFGSGKDWEAKIKYIFDYLMPKWTDWALHGYVIPGIIALVWIYIFPYILHPIALFHEKKLNENRKNMYEASEKRVLTQEDADTLRSHILDQRLKIQEEREKILKTQEEHINSIAELKSEKTNIETKLEASAAANEESSREFNDLEIRYSALEKRYNEKDAPEYEIEKESNIYSSEGKKEIIEKIGLSRNASDVFTMIPEFSVRGPYNHITWPGRSKHHIKFQDTTILKANRPFDDEMVAAALIFAELLKKENQNIPSKKVPDLVKILETHGLKRPDYAIYQLSLHGVFENIKRNSPYMQLPHISKLGSLFLELGFEVSSTSPKFEDIVSTTQ